MVISDADLKAMLSLAVSTARAAGELVRSASVDKLRMAVKSSPTDIVTEMDRASEELIMQRILDARPDDGIIGEEGASRNSTSGINWLIDPIDGTVNYSRGLPNYAISIAAEANGETLVGVVFDPTLDETFTATRGRGSTLDGRRIACASTPFSQAIIGTGFSYSSSRRALQAETLRPLLPAIGDIRRPGSAAISLCWVACGRLDAFYEAGLQPWDFAAGALIAAEAGVAVESRRAQHIDSELLIASAPAITADLHKLLIGSLDRSARRKVRDLPAGLHGQTS